MNMEHIESGLITVASNEPYSFGSTPNFLQYSKLFAPTNLDADVKSPMYFIAAETSQSIIV